MAESQIIILKDKFDEIVKKVREKYHIIDGVSEIDDTPIERLFLQRWKYCVGTTPVDSEQERIFIEEFVHKLKGKSLVYKDFMASVLSITDKIELRKFFVEGSDNQLLSEIHSKLVDEIEKVQEHKTITVSPSSSATLTTSASYRSTKLRNILF